MTSSDLSLADLESFDPGAKGRARRERRFCCPLCNEGRALNDAHRCLAVNSDTGAWNCHRCKAKGLLAEFRKTRNAEPKKKPGLREAARRAFLLPTPTELPPKDPHAEKDPPYNFDAILSSSEPIEGTPGGSYLESRGIPLHIAKSAGAKYSPGLLAIGPAVLFLLQDKAGAIVGAQGRAIGSSSQKRTLKKGQAPHGGVFATPGGLECLSPIITEAPIDALSLATCKAAAIATVGTSCPAWIYRAFAFRVVFLAHDNDSAGDAAAEQIAGKLRACGAKPERLRPPGGCKDWNEALQRFGAEALTQAIEAAIGGCNMTCPPNTSPVRGTQKPDSEALDPPNNPSSPEPPISAPRAPKPPQKANSDGFPRVDPRRGTVYQLLSQKEKSRVCAFSPVPGAEELQRELRRVRRFLPPDYLAQYRLVAAIEAAAREANSQE